MISRLISADSGQLAQYVALGVYSLVAVVTLLIIVLDELHGRTPDQAVTGLISFITGSVINLLGVRAGSQASVNSINAGNGGRTP